MDWFVKAFIKSSVTWLGVGVTLGVAMAVHPEWGVLRTAHVHINVVGFVGMMIFGVAYHVIPRFTGIPLRSPRIAATHFVIANIGLAIMVVGFAMRGMGKREGSLVLAIGGSIEALGAYLFGWLIFQTLRGHDALMRRQALANAATSRSPLPTARG